jgi:hypothetical protein
MLLVEALETADELRLDAVEDATQRNEIIAQRDIREAVDLFSREVVDNVSKVLNAALRLFKHAGDSTRTYVRVAKAGGGNSLVLQALLGVRCTARCVRLWEWASAITAGH